MKEIKFLNLLPSLVGIPYIKNGRNLKGFDCLGFILWVYNNVFELNITDYTDKKQADILKELENNWLVVRKEEMNLGDLVTCSTKKNKQGKRFYNHAGIAISPLKFIHCAKNKGVLISNINVYDRFMEKVNVFRFKGV